MFYHDRKESTIARCLRSHEDVYKLVGGPLCVDTANGGLEVKPFDPDDPRHKKFKTLPEKM